MCYFKALGNNWRKMGEIHKKKIRHPSKACIKKQSVIAQDYHHSSWKLEARTAATTLLAWATTLLAWAIRNHTSTNKQTFHKWERQQWHKYINKNVGGSMDGEILTPRGVEQAGFCSRSQQQRLSRVRGPRKAIPASASPHCTLQSLLHAGSCLPIPCILTVVYGMGKNH